MGINRQLRLAGGEHGAWPETCARGARGKPVGGGQPPAEPPAARSRLCPGTLCFAAPPAPTRPPQHPQPRTAGITPGIGHRAPARGTPAAGKRLPLGIALEQRDSECAHLGRRHGTVPATILVLLSRAVAPWLPGSAAQPARAPAGAMQGMSMRTGGRPPGPAEAHPHVRAPGSTGDSQSRARERVGAGLRGRAAPGQPGPSSLRRSQRLGRDLEHRGFRAERDGEPGPRES